MWVGMTLMQKDCVVQCHLTVDGFLSSFKFYDLEVQRMNLCWKLSYPERFQIVLVPAILEEQVEVLVVLNFLHFQDWEAMDFDCPLVVFRTRFGIDFPEILHLS
jgi:hypothetical protein